jgi:hypothetical protein
MTQWPGMRTESFTGSAGVTHGHRQDKKIPSLFSVLRALSRMGLACSGQAVRQSMTVAAFYGWAARATTQRAE